MIKTFRLTIAILLFHMAAHGQYVNIPDTGFRSWLIRLYPTCFNTAGQMDTTRSEIVNERSLIVYAYVAALPSWQVYNVYNLEGLQYFKNLQTLKIEAYFVNYIPQFPATIKTLTLENARLLSAIPPLPAGLQRLNYTNSSTNTLPPLPPALRHLEITNNLIREIPVLPEGLQYLSCHSNARLASFPVLPVSLLDLQMYSNDSLYTHPVLPALLKRFRYTSSTLLNLPPLPDNLKLLDIGGPNIINLPALPSGLDSLRVTGSKITTLPLLPTSLRYLNCSSNEFLTTIPNLPPGLKRLECQNMRFGPNNSYYGYGRLTNLPPLPNSLVYLSCAGNLLSAISQIPPAMDTLWCANNRFTQLPTTPNGVLKVLFCDSNLITELPVLPKTTLEIRCHNNRIERIVSLPESLVKLHCYANNLYCIPRIPNNPQGQLLELLVDLNKVKCLPNYPTQRLQGYSYGNLALPLCNPTNNLSHCSAFPIMSGTVFYDINGNGIKDAGELAKANTRIALSSTSYTITDNNGRYEIGAPDTGRYSISITAPTYYDAVPSSIQYRFNTYDTLVTGNFALQANTAIDSAAINLNPGNWAARPGFAYSYIVGYENAGTTTLSANIVLDYDETMLTYDSSSVPLVVNSGGRLSLPVSNFLPGQRRYFIAYFRIKTTALRGDSLHATTTIDNGNVLAQKSFAMIIGGSYDPNDKQGTPALTPAQVANGDYIDYTIRFQNTGTDTAFTVIISDTLSNDLQTNTLELVNASHSCKATVKNNVVFFEFLNILLPDSNVNEIKSHGFVSFKIKPRNTIAVNSNINNKAAIYFDYNAPVITNTAITAIRNPTVPLPLRLMSFTAARSTANTALLEWNTANEINTSKFIIQQSTDGRTFTNCGTEAARAGQYNFYRSMVTVPTETVYLKLKMLDVDGKFTYSPVVLLRKQGSKALFTILNNPVKGTLHIDVADAALYNTTARIINAQGVVVKTIQLQNNLQLISLNLLQPGTYFLHTTKGADRFVVVQ